jgi:hypothetical protein
VIGAFGRFLWDFVVGDDWMPAAGVVMMLAVAALVVHQGGANAWWLFPPVVIALLALSVARAIPRPVSRPDDTAADHAREGR